MADRLTQLQEAVNQLADYFCNSIGILQQTQDTNSTVEENKEAGSSPESSNITLFANLITRTACDIDLLIDSLPSQEYTIEKQAEMLKNLEVENHRGAEKLEQVLQEGESLLVKVRDANRSVSDYVLSLNPSTQDEDNK